jgi:hypothetical protein
MERIFQVVLRNDIHRDVCTTFLCILLIVIGCILISQANWSEETREMYYANSGIIYDVVFLVLIPSTIALLVGVAELAWYLSPSSITRKEEE